jgi:hypothetical protein
MNCKRRVWGGGGWVGGIYPNPCCLVKQMLKTRPELINQPISWLRASPDHSVQDYVRTGQSYNQRRTTFSTESFRNSRKLLKIEDFRTRHFKSRLYTHAYTHTCTHTNKHTRSNAKKKNKQTETQTNNKQTKTRLTNCVRYGLPT